MKKRYLFLIASILVLSMLLASCGGAEGKNESTETNAPAESNEKETKPNRVESSEGKIPAGYDLEKLYESLMECYSEQPTMIPLDSTLLADFYGITPEMYSQAVVYFCETGIDADEIWLIEAVDEAAAAQVAALANQNLANKIASFKDYLPDEYAIAKEGKVITTGNFVLLLVSPEVDAMQDYIDSLK